MSSTLLQLRNGTADLCMDLIEFTASSGGSTSVLTDSFNAVEADHHFRGTEVLCYDAVNVANEGQQRRVLDSELSTYSLTLASALPQNITIGDDFYGYNIGGVGARIAEYNRTINDVIRGAGPAARVFHTDDLDDLYDVYDPWVAIPAEFTHLYGVMTDDESGIFYNIDTANDLMESQDGWYVDQTNKLLAISGNAGRLAHGQTIRLLGFKVHPELTTDASTTDLDFEWLTFEAASRILTRNRDQIKKQMGAGYKNAAEQLRVKMSFATPKNTIRIR